MSGSRTTNEKILPALYCDLRDSGERDQLLRPCTFGERGDPTAFQSCLRVAVRVPESFPGRVCSYGAGAHPVSPAMPKRHIQLLSQSLPCLPRELAADSARPAKSMSVCPGARAKSAEILGQTDTELAREGRGGAGVGGADPRVRGSRGGSAAVYS
ncbi:hypothetical protein GCM10020360_30820 [Nonlabens tegetincola]